MLVLVRTLTYATLFVGFLLVYVPARILSWSGMVRPSGFAWPQAVGLLVTTVGAALALWCVADFAWIGKGTPAPFDPPRQLVMRGPYRFVRNPMYIGAITAVIGAALYYQSGMLAIYCVAFLIVTHLFVVLYEEPTLRKKFGPEYQAYCGQVHRWRPRIAR